MSEGAIRTLSNAVTQIPAIGNTTDHASTYLAMTNFGIPLTGSMSAMEFIIFILIYCGVVIFTVHISIIVLQIELLLLLYLYYYYYHPMLYSTM
jgi:hypothetical protein